MAELPSKESLKRDLVRVLAAELETAERAQRAALEGATHEEAKPENDKDTRALEASYLARGQARRLEELRAGLAEVEAMRLRDFGEDAPVALGALVTAEGASGEASFFLAPHGGGAKLADGRVQVVTPKSPLGRALLGKREGDDCDLAVEGKRRELSIVRVR
jgi:transcription elongation GreA/GreB family factor